MIPLSDTAGYRIETTSTTWREVERYVAARIEQLRLLLERPGTPAAETERYRGEIAALRGILRLATPDAPRLPDTDYLTP